MEERKDKRVYQSLASEGSEHFEEEYEEDSYSSEDDDDDDEYYLKPGEPYGTVLPPSETPPYIRRQRVVELNEELFVTKPGKRTLPIRVNIREDLNQYFSKEDDSEQEDKHIRKSVSTAIHTPERNGPSNSYKNDKEESWQSPQKASPLKEEFNKANLSTNVRRQHTGNESLTKSSGDQKS